MSEQKKVTKKMSREALEEVEQSLAEVPLIQGLGVVKHRPDGEYRVALYVSSYPKDEVERAALPESISLSESGQKVKTEIIEIGEVQAEEQGDLSEALEKVASMKRGMGGDGSSPMIGKEPM